MPFEKFLTEVRLLGRELTYDTKLYVLVAMLFLLLTNVVAFVLVLVLATVGNVYLPMRKTYREVAKESEYNSTDTDK